MDPICHGRCPPGSRRGIPILRHQGPALPPPEGLSLRNLFRYRTKAADRSLPGSRPSRRVALDFQADQTCPIGPMYLAPGLANPDTTGGRFLHETLAITETNINATSASPTALATIEITGRPRLHAPTALARCRRPIGVHLKLGRVSSVQEILARVSPAQEMPAAMPAVRLAALPIGVERNFRRVDTIMRRQWTETAVLIVVRHNCHGRGELPRARVGLTRDRPGSLLFPHHCRHLQRRLRRKDLQSTPSAHDSSRRIGLRFSTQPELPRSTTRENLQFAPRREIKPASGLRERSHRDDPTGHRRTLPSLIMSATIATAAIGIRPVPGLHGTRKRRQRPLQDPRGGRRTTERPRPGMRPATNLAQIKTTGGSTSKTPIMVG